MIVQNIKKHIENIIFDMFSFSMTIEYAKKGDAQLACPLFQLAKEKNQSPQDIFQALEKQIFDI
jgi:arginyl-tRNA synthetase